jgi:hypothetical protein
VWFYYKYFLLLRKNTLVVYNTSVVVVNTAVVRKIGTWCRQTVRSILRIKSHFYFANEI